MYYSHKSDRLHFVLELIGFYRWFDTNFFIKFSLRSLKTYMYIGGLVEYLWP